MDIPDRKLIKLKNDLEKGHVMPVYFLFGEDIYFLRMAASFFKTILLQNELKDLNCSVFYTIESKPNQIIQSANTLPFMAPYRLVIVKQAEKFDASDWKKFNLYFKSPSTATCLVFLIKNDSLKKVKKNYLSNLKEFGAVIQFLSPKTYEIESWIKFFANKYKKTITSQSAFILKELLGNNLSIIDQELNKISLFVGDKKNIDTDDINIVSISTKIESVFSLISKISEKKKKESLIILKKLIYKGDPPLVILSLLIKQYRRLTLIKGKEIEGLGYNEIKAELKKAKLDLHDFFLKSLFNEAHKVSFEELTEAYKLITNTDLELKKSRINKEIILENLVFNLCN